MATLTLHLELRAKALICDLKQRNPEKKKK